MENYLLKVLENYRYPLHNVTVKSLIGFIKEAQRQEEEVRKEYSKNIIEQRSQTAFQLTPNTYSTLKY